jgi:hypothetical protein
MCWFIFISSLEWWYLRDAPWLPSFLGGPENGEILLKSWDADLVTIYQLQIGYHIQSLIFAVINGAKPEMHVHHVVTVTLVACSYYFGYLRFGAVVFLLHDVPDIAGYLTKALVEVHSKRAILVAFVLLVGCWAYCRLYLFAQLVFFLYATGETVERSIYYTHTVMLGLLLCLHIYWFLLFFAMLVRTKKTGQTQDISEVKSQGRPTEPPKPHSA